MKTLYDVLGVPADSSEEEIKRAYRKKALKSHPDREKDSSEAMKEINEAYAVLSDPNRRSRYNETGDTSCPVSKMSPEEQILCSFFMMILESILNSDQDVKYVDMISLVSRSLEKQIRESESTEKKGLRRVRDLKEVLGRISSKEENGSIKECLDAQIISLTAQLDKCRKEIEDLKKARSLLKSYKYKVDPLTRSKQITGSTLGWSTSTQ